MTYDPDKHHRRSIRLPGYDYAQPGAYFVTICTHQRECFLSEIVNGAVHLSTLGCVVQSAWKTLPDHYPHVALDAFVVMPNHVHGVIVLKDIVVGAGFQTRPSAETRPIKRHALPEIVRGFKTYSARDINKIRGMTGVLVWQRNYYEHIIRDDEERHAIREYVAKNPLRWELDRDNPIHFTS